MAKVLTGQAARDYLKKNPNATYKAYDSAGQVINSKEEDRGLFGGLLQALTKPLADFGNAAGAAYEDKSQPSKYLTSDQRQKLIDNPAAYIGQKGLGAATTLIPFGGGVKTAAAASGAMGLSEADLSNPGDILSKTATGAISGGLFAKAAPLVGKLIGGVGKKFTPEAEKAGANAVTELSAGLGKAFKDAEGSFEKGAEKRFSNFKQGLRGAELDVSAGADVGNPMLLKRQTQNVLDTLGEPQDINGIVRGKQKVGDLMDTYVDDVFAKNPKARIEGDDIFGSNFQDEINSIAIGTGVKPEDINSFAKGLIGQGKYGEFSDIVTRKYTVGDLKQVLQDVNSALRNKNITGVRRLYAEEVKKAIYDKMAKEAPQYKDIARSYAVLAQNEKATALKALKGDQSASQSGLFGLQGVLPISETKNKVARMTGDILEKGVKLPKSKAVSDNLQRFEDFASQKGIPQTKIAQLAGSQIALEMFDADGNGQLDEQETANAEASGALGGEGLPSEGQSLGMEGDSPEAIYNDAFQMLLQQTGDPVTARKQAAALVGFDPMSQGSEIELTANMKQQKAALTDSAAQLDVLGGEADKFQSEIPLLGGVLSKNPWDAKRKGYVTRLKATLQNVAKGMEGGKLTDADREYYMSFLPDENATPQAFAEQIAVLKDMVASKQASLQTQ